MIALGVFFLRAFSFLSLACFEKPRERALGDEPKFWADRERVELISANIFLDRLRREADALGAFGDAQTERNLNKGHKKTSRAIVCCCVRSTHLSVPAFRNRNVFEWKRVPSRITLRTPKRAYRFHLVTRHWRRSLNLLRIAIPCQYVRYLPFEHGMVHLSTKVWSAGEPPRWRTRATNRSRYYVSHPIISTWSSPKLISTELTAQLPERPWRSISSDNSSSAAFQISSEVGFFGSFLQNGFSGQ